MISCMEQLWAAVRRSPTKEEFIDLTTIDMDVEMVLQKVNDQKEETPLWDKRNMVIRISRCVLTETPGRAK